MADALAQLSEARSAVNKLMWELLTPEERTAITAPAVKASLASRAKDPKIVRSKRAAANASSITPESARARALKAWETKRKKKEEQETRRKR